MPKIKVCPGEDQPTTIEDGVMTEKQRKNSKLYNQPETARSLIKKADEDLTIIIGERYPINNSPDGTWPSQEAYLQNLSCDSDAIVTGRVKRKSSQLSEDSRSVFTDYEFEIRGVYKNESPIGKEVGDLITLTRSGGKLKLGRHTISVFDKSFKTLSIGKEYLLFLKYLSNSSSFKPSDIESTFEVSGKQIRRFSDTSARYEFGSEDLDSFLNFIRNTTSACF